jgi:erythromycin esterase-like protein
LTSAKKQLAAVVDSNSFWLLVMDNLIQQAKAVRTEFITGKPAIFERDIQMAKNLKWLNENKFKNQKIVVWAADAHIVKSLKNMKEAFFDKQPTLGDSFVTNLKNNDKVYILGFTSYRGTAGRLGFKHYKLYPPRNNGFENWINKDYPYAFVDFDEFNKIYPDAGEYFYMTALGHFNYEGKWNQLFDGVFFIRDMYPCAANR